MLKRKIFAVALPLVVGATIVGAGFSAWVFDNADIKSDANIGVTVTNGEVDLKNIKAEMMYSTNSAPTQFKTLEKGTAVGLVLDQGNKLDQTNTPDKKGIHFTVGGEVLHDIKIAFTGKNTDLATLTDAGYRIQVDLSVTFNTALLEYVNLATQTEWTNVKQLTADKININKYTLQDNLCAVGTNVGVGALNEFVFHFGSTVDSTTSVNKYHSNKMFSWKAKPTDTSTLTTMRSKLASLNGATAEASGVAIDFGMKLLEAKAI